MALASLAERDVLGLELGDPPALVGDRCLEHFDPLREHRGISGRLRSGTRRRRCAAPLRRTRTAIVVVDAAGSCSRGGHIAWGSWTARYRGRGYLRGALGCRPSLPAPPVSTQPRGPPGTETWSPSSSCRLHRVCDVWCVVWCGVQRPTAENLERPGRPVGGGSNHKTPRNQHAVGGGFRS